jgi:hypothetical protein
MKHEGAAKRERAIAYALSHQVHVVSTYLSSVVNTRLYYIDSFMFITCRSIDGVFVSASGFKTEGDTKLSC